VRGGRRSFLRRGGGGSGIVLLPWRGGWIRVRSAGLALASLRFSRKASWSWRRYESLAVVLESLPHVGL